ncbi:nuclear transport factor 2 family protein [Leptolyngbya sp. AN02str]|uniref:nuclear transport factor 2 family protein n=1 Tax=Leptolyngbya sp. AN02str TaxID=3423363 RepID=UPI003D31FCA8
MRKMLRRITSISQSQANTPTVRRRASHRMLASSVLAGLILSIAPSVVAQTRSTPTAPSVAPATDAPAELVRLVNELDTLASREDSRSLMRLVSRNFTHSDGLTYDTLSEALQLFWERYDQLNYRTTITAWQQEGDTWTAETATRVTGVQKTRQREFRLSSTVTSRQTYQNGQLLSQEILTEENQVTSGTNAPNVAVQAPSQIRTAAPYGFDVIVDEPLGDRQLLGTAIEEGADVNGYLNNSAIMLDLLNAGGLFKTGRAPALPSDRWLSGIIVREDGITMVTRRLRATQ